MLGETTLSLGSTGNEELYCKDHIGLIQSFILDYTNKNNAVNKLQHNILKSQILTLNRYKEMVQFYHELLLETTSNTSQDDDETVLTINSPTFEDIENKTFIKLNCEHQTEMEKIDKTLRNSNSDYLEIWGNINKMKYEVIETYTNLHIWEENENGINITSLCGLVVYYKNNEKVSLVINKNRSLCIPFLLLPTNNKINKLLMDLIHHPTAVPFFRTVFSPKVVALANLRNMIKLNNLPIVNDIRAIHSNIKEIITEDDIDNLFGDEDEHELKQKKRKRPKRKKPINTSTIDISNITDNNVVETEPVDEAELIYEKDETDERDERDSTTDEEESIVLENINNINNDIIVRFNKIPFNIVFYKYEYISYADKDLINFMITDLYNTNNKFKIFMEQYDTIRILASFHNDYSAKNNSLHFNGVFYNTVDVIKSSVYHFYIKNNCISSLTTIINVL
jgi:hypothetical protein